MTPGPESKLDNAGSPRTATADLIVFGGAFDPPHADHLAAVKAAVSHFPGCRVWVLPAAAPAVAGGGAKAPAASFRDRLAMATALFGPLAPQVQVLPLEDQLQRPNYTVNTLRRVAELAPEARLGLLIGQDQALSFPAWREPEAILALADLVVVGRREFQHNEGAKSFGGLRSALETLFLGLPAARDRTHLLVGLDVGPAASHIIRERLASGATLPPGWLPPAVAAYVRDHALYGLAKEPQ